MDFTIVEVFNRSVTIELASDSIFKQEKSFEVLIDGEKALESDRNVVSVSGLLPDREYKIAVVFDGEKVEKSFTTKHESVLLDVTKFGAKGDGKTVDTAALQAAMMFCRWNCLSSKGYIFDNSSFPQEQHDLLAWRGRCSSGRY